MKFPVPHPKQMCCPRLWNWNKMLYNRTWRSLVRATSGIWA